MSVHEVAPLIQAALGAALLLLILAKVGLSRPLTRWFALFILGQMLWGLAVFGLRASSDLDLALRWERLAPSAVSLTVISFYYFCRVMVAAPHPRWIAVLAAAHLSVSLASVPTPYLVEGVETASYGNTAIFGGGFLYWTLPVYLIMGFALVTLYHGYKRATSYTEKNRLLLILIAASFSVLGSILDVIPVLGLDVPPATSWTNSLFFILAAVAILRYRLFDIQVALQHRFSYLVRSCANLAIGALGVLVFWRVGLPPWSMVFLVIALLLGAEPMWRRVDAFLRVRLEKDLRQDLQTLLTTFGTGQTGSNALQVAETLTNLLHRVIHPTHSTLLVFQGDYARPIFSLGYAVAPEEPLPSTHPLVQWLTHVTEPVFHSDLMVEPQFQTMPRHSLQMLSSLEATLYVPLSSHESLEGILGIGPKTRGAVYSWQEIEFLRSVGQHGALLLESLRLSEAERVRKEQMDRMRELQRYMVQARDDERRTLATAIHDEPIQMLAGSLVRLNLIRDSLVTRPDLSRQQIDHVLASLVRAESSLRRIMTGVFPPLLQDLGLHTALEALYQDLERNGSHMTPVHLNVEAEGLPEDWSPPLAVSLVIYRFIQEGLRNALSHSGATEAWVTIDYGAEVATLRVLDNGRGIDPERIASRRREGHVGLMGLEERLGALSGSLSLNNRLEGGACLQGQFPHQAASPRPETRWSSEYNFVPIQAAVSPEEAPAKASVQNRSSA